MNLWCGVRVAPRGGGKQSTRLIERDEEIAADADIGPSIEAPHRDTDPHEPTACRFQITSIVNQSPPASVEHRLPLIRGMQYSLGSRNTVEPRMQ